MKKILVWLLLVIMTVSLAACGKDEPTLVGTWKCNDFNQMFSAGMGAAGSITGMDSLGSFGDSINVDVTLTFKQDGTYQMDMSANIFILGTQTETVTGTYTYKDNTLTMDGSPLRAKLSSKTLILEEDTSDGYVIKLTFEKQ